jgi:hypothetical protein
MDCDRVHGIGGDRDDRDERHCVLIATRTEQLNCNRKDEFMNEHTTPEPRKGTPSPRLEEPEFRRRFLSQFKDPAFNPLRTELDRVVAAAWDAYKHQRKSPETSKAGQGFHDPDYDLAVVLLSIASEDDSTIAL